MQCKSRDVNVYVIKSSGSLRKDGSQYQTFPTNRKRLQKCNRPLTDVVMHGSSRRRVVLLVLHQHIQLVIMTDASQ